jgi:hypothetical protein
MCKMANYWEEYKLLLVSVKSSARISCSIEEVTMTLVDSSLSASSGRSGMHGDAPAALSGPAEGRHAYFWATPVSPLEATTYEQQPRRGACRTPTLPLYYADTLPYIGSISPAASSITYSTSQESAHEVHRSVLCYFITRSERLDFQLPMASLAGLATSTVVDVSPTIFSLVYNYCRFFHPAQQ